MANPQLRENGCEKVAIFSEGSRGRGVRATTLIEPETTLLIEAPYVTALQEDFRRILCSFCYQKRENLRACGGCGFVYYCDRQCQSSNYSNHQYECKFLKTANCDVNLRTRTLLMAVQKHLLQQKRSKKSRTHDAYGFPVTPDELYKKKTVCTVQEQQPDILHFWEFVKEKRLSVTEELVQWFQGILDANMFSIYDETTSTSIGEGLYTRLAMVNHSCRPNCVFTCNGREIRIASIRTISPGEECCISYMNLMIPTSSRQSKLKKQYDFDCDCTRCTQGIDKDRLMYAIKCPQMNCRGSVLPWEPTNSLKGSYQACDICGCDVQLSELLSKIEQTEAEFVRSWKEMKNCNYHGHVLEKCDAILTLLDTVYQPYHARVYKVLKKAFKVSLELSEAETALKYGTRLLVPLRMQLDVGDAWLGYNLWRVSKLQAKLGLKLKAARTLQEALPTIRIAYGTDHPITVEAQELLVSLTAGKDEPLLTVDSNQPQITQA